MEWLPAHRKGVRRIITKQHITELLASTGRDMVIAEQFGHIAVGDRMSAIGQGYKTVFSQAELRDYLESVGGDIDKAVAWANEDPES